MEMAMPIIQMTLSGMELGVGQTAPIVSSTTLLGSTPYCHRPPRMMWKHATFLVLHLTLRMSLCIYWNFL